MMPPEAPLISTLRSLLDDPDLTRGARLQSLWSGYGEIVRIHRGDGRTVVVKHVRPPGGAGVHPRGWGTDRSHARKLRSYAVERAWYADWAPRCGEGCRVPACLAAQEVDGGWLFVLEDLDAAGFPGRHARSGDAALRRCLEWLAAFHATFLGAAPRGLWPVGTYWHLATRPEELAAIADPRLRRAAGPIDEVLSGARFQTLVHGDAKVANFCFAPDASAVAAVDFQYVGGGCGMKDVAYLLGSALGSAALDREAAVLEDHYFRALRARLGDREVDVDALEAEWRALHDWAWADFQRFLAGWAPDHAKVEGHALARTARVLAAVEGRS
ncbi:MAG: phosphotransferase [Myxococcales bacterium]|nr:phosphotransferase [Myxococcales bacterium]